MRYTESSAVRRLLNNGIEVSQGLITIPFDKQIKKYKQVGNKLWGCIDFLCNYCRYLWMHEMRF